MYETRVADCHLESIDEALTAVQRDRILTWVLSNPNDLATRRRALQTWPLASKHHAAVRTLAERDVPGALVALARYKDEADVPLILKKLKPDSYEALVAVETFRHKQLFPRLLRMKDKALDFREGWTNEGRQYLRAVASFRTAAARDVLAAVLKLPNETKHREYIMEFAFEAVAVHFDPLYTALALAYWRERPILNLPFEVEAGGPYPEDRLIAALGKSDPKVTWEVIRRQFRRKDFHQHSERALEAMVRIVLRERTRVEAFNLIGRGVWKASARQLPVLAKYMAAHKPEGAVPILLRRLTTTRNGHVQVTAVEALLAYGRKDVRERIASLLASGAIPANDWAREAIRHRLKEAEKGE